MNSARGRTNQSEKILIESIEQWAESSGLTEDVFLNRLLLDLRQRQDLAKWANIDALDYLPHALNYASGNKRRFVERLILIRNVLVFAPVALTWLGIFQATRAFSAYTSENGNSVLNFLDFWQNGYGYLPAEWRIGTIAYTDSLILFIIISLTLFTGTLGVKIARDLEVVHAKQDSERALIAATINMYLVDKKKLTTASIAQSLNASLDRLSRSSLALEKTSQILIKDAQQVIKSRESQSKRLRPPRQKNNQGQ
jgi:hypothetical protein